MPKLEAGARVTDKIVLQRPLGKGAMADVWRAHHAGLDTDVAVKFLFASAARQNPRLLQRFRSEASVAAKIRSPYVVQMLDYGVTEDERPFLVMEMLDGEPLDRLLARRGTLSLAEVATVVRHVGKALAKAHAMGVVHRDIKPANLFHVGGDELFIKVLDFGIAKQAEIDGKSLTLAGEVTGTPRYMSPEQLADSKDVDSRTDLWALGVVAYELLTGTPPFASDSLPDLYLAVCAGRYPEASSRLPDLAPAVDRWFARALSVDRELRFPSAEMMVAELPHDEMRASTAAPPAATAPPATPVAPLAPQPTVVATWAMEPAPPAQTLDAFAVPAAPRDPSIGAAGVPVETGATPSPRVSPASARLSSRGLWGAIALFAVLVSGAALAVVLFAQSEPRAPAASPAAPSSAPPEVATGPAEPAPTAPVAPTEPSAAESAAASAAPSSGRAPVLAPRPSTSPTAKTPKPNCEGDNAYIVKPDGTIIPKPGCF